MTPGVPAQADIGLFFVSPESLDCAEARAIVADEDARLLRALLISNRLQELADPQPPCISCSTLRRQRVICTDDLVTVRNVCFGTEEERPIIPEMVQEITRIPG